jgi:hypothetical protein
MKHGGLAPQYIMEFNQIKWACLALFLSRGILKGMLLKFAHSK